MNVLVVVEGGALTRERRQRRFFSSPVEEVGAWHPGLLEEEGEASWIVRKDGARGGGRDRGGLADAAWGAVLATFCRMSARIYVNMCECVEKRVSVSA